MNKILIIEDDLEINALLADFLKEKGYAVHCQYDGLHVLDFLNKEKIISVTGLGYVGLPLALEFAKHFKVIGFDINVR